VPWILAACGDGGDDAFDLDARRAALGLQDTPQLAVEDAMKEMDLGGYERRLANGRLGLEEALKVENLLRRIDAADRPDEFRALLKTAVESSGRYARSLTDAAAQELGGACIDCHVTYRPR